MAGKKVGILAMQGAFIEHEAAIKKCGAEAFQIRTGDELEKVDGLIIPGGESTTIGKLMQATGLDQKIREKHQAGMPIWGTCAGMILLAKEIADMQQPGLELMNIKVIRNAFGRQVDSFETELDIDGIGKCRGVFIRAPYIERVGEGVRIMAYHDSKIVMVEEDNLLATAFHPELTLDTSIHDYFLQKIR